jgi:hypothetical protein
MNKKAGSICKAGSRLVAYPRNVSVWTVARIILPLQNVDTVIRNGLFAHLAVFSRRIKGATRVAVVPVWTGTRCIVLCFSAPHKGQLDRCIGWYATEIRNKSGRKILSRCIGWYATEIRYGDTQQVWTRLNKEIAHNRLSLGNGTVSMFLFCTTSKLWVLHQLNESYCQIVPLAHTRSASRVTGAYYKQNCCA